MFIIYQKSMDVSLFFVIPIKKQARFGAGGSMNIHLFAIIRLKIGFKLLNFIGRGTKSVHN